MKNIFLTLLSLMAITLSTQAKTTIEAADEAYNAARFEEAVKLYSAAIDSIGPNSNLYYNLGNALYRTGKNASAILAYEKALKLDPTHRDARANLGFVNSKIMDRPTERGTVMSQALNSLLDTMKPNSWAWLALTLFVLTLAAAATYVMSTNIMLRKTGFFGGIALLVLTCIAIFLAVKAGARVTSHDHGIVMAETTILSTEPRQPASQSEEADVLHSGAKVEIVDSMASTTDSVPTLWLEVIVDNSTRGWMKGSDIERF